MNNTKNNPGLEFNIYNCLASLSLQYVIRQWDTRTITVFLSNHLFLYEQYRFLSEMKYLMQIILRGSEATVTILAL